MVNPSGWRENVEVNLASDEWLMWLGAGLLACLVAVLVSGVRAAFRPPSREPRSAEKLGLTGNGE